MAKTNKKNSQKKDEKPEVRLLDDKTYEKELDRLQIELVQLQEWVKKKGLKVVVIFEGRDAAGKGGVIKRITQCLSPRVCRVVALAAPILGAVADRGSARKRFLAIFAYLGVLMTAALYFVGQGQWAFALVVYAMGVIGFSGATDDLNVAGLGLTKSFIDDPAIPFDST